MADQQQHGVQVYNLVWDTAQLKRFMTQFLPCAAKNHGSHFHVTMVQLMARRKYLKSGDTTASAGNLSASTQCMTRLFLTGNTMGADGRPCRHVGDGVAGAVRAIQRLQVPLGTYVDKDGETPIPPDALVLYAHIIPRDVLQAIAQTQVTVMQDLSLGVCQVRSDLVEGKHPWKVLHANMARTPAPFYKKLRHLDIDTKEPSHLKRVAALLQEHSIEPKAVIETRNGFHIVYDHDALNKMAHKAMYELHKASALVDKPRDGDYWFNMSKGENVAIPGTIQAGNFCVRYVDNAPACWL